MTTFATLPGDVLTAIASYVDGPQIVVAVASDADARTALAVGGDLCCISLAVLEGRAHGRGCPSTAHAVVVYFQWLTLGLFDFLRFAVVASFRDAR